MCAQAKKAGEELISQVKQQSLSISLNLYDLDPCYNRWGTAKPCHEGREEQSQDERAAQRMQLGQR